MRDFSLPPVVEPMRAGSPADSVHDPAERDPEFAQLARRGGGDGEWVTLTAAAFRDEVGALAKGLLAEGLRFNDRVAVTARTRYEWTLFSYALWTIGAQRRVRSPPSPTPPAPPGAPRGA